MNTIDNAAISNELIAAIGTGYQRRPLFCDSLIDIGKKTIDRLIAQNELIQSFYSAVSEIGRLVLSNQLENALKSMLFSEQIMGMGLEYHSNLPEFGWNPPLLYRTDQSINGKIFEIQAPGSGWGDIPLIFRILSNLKGTDNLYEKYRQEYIAKYVKTIQQITNQKSPKVGHFLDASSNPASMRYLLSITSNHIKYWGMDEKTSMHDLDCVISHSAISILSLNFCEEYFRKASNKELSFVLPPNLLFDQKIIYALPFLKSTKSFFSDQVRNMFPYTTYIDNNGFLLEDNTFITIEDFVQLPESQRHYYLKYAGPNTNFNWGSRSVYRLNKKSSFEALRKAGELSQRGQIWIIQSDVTTDSDICSIDYSRDINEIIRAKNHVKLSAFYSPFDYFGCKVMFRNHYKVHGTSDTYVGVGICDE